MTRSLSRWFATAALATGIWSSSAPTRAQDLAQEAANPTPEPWQAGLGFRSTFVRRAGFDPFSGSDILPQLSFTAQHLVIHQDAFAFAGGASFDYGGSNADARGVPASLRVVRLTLVAEGRYYPWQRAYTFARFAPGILRAAAK